MTHKVHPKIYRIREISDWDSRGFYGKKFPQFLREDFEIRKFLNKKLLGAGVQSIEIERFSTKINIIINTARPGLVIGRGGKGIEELKTGLENKIFKNDKSQKKIDVQLEIREVKDPWSKASLVSQGVAQQLQKRIPYKRVLKQAMDKVMAHKEVKGAKIEIAGRLDGAEMCRTQWLKAGQLPLQTIRADIDYAQAQAYCTYGVIGIKVWIYKGERFC